MQSVTGGTLPARLWRDFAVAALQKMPVRNLPVEVLDTSPDQPAAGDKANPVETFFKDLFKSVFGN